MYGYLAVRKQRKKMANLIEDLIQGLTPSQNFTNVEFSENPYVSLTNQGYIDKKGMFIKHGIQILSTDYHVIISRYDKGYEIDEEYDVQQIHHFYFFKPKNIQVYYEGRFLQIVINENFSIIEKSEEGKLCYYEIHSL